MTRNYIKNTADMHLDILRFHKFAPSWNGVSVIPNTAYNKVITVDASSSGIAGFDEKLAYGSRITPLSDPVANISELEAVNVAMAVQLFLTREDKGRHIMVRCNNLGSVEVFRSGKVNNRIILGCANTSG